MKAVILLLIALAAILAACQDQTAPSSCPSCDCAAQVAQARVETQRSQVSCPFNIHFTKPYVAQKYLETKVIRSSLHDKDCNDAFAAQYNTSTYLCFIKEANPLKEAGRDKEGNLLWQWQLICGCSYEE